MGLQLFALLISRLGQTRFSSWNVTPFLNNRLLDLPWVGAGPGAHLLRDVNALLSWLEQWNQLGDVLTLLLGLQVACLLWDFRDDSFGLWEAFLWARDQLATGWSTELLGDLLTLGLRRILFDILLLGLTDLLGPFGTLLLCGVALSDILTLLLLDGLTLDDIILNIVLMVPGLALRLVDGPTFNWALAITDQRSVAEFDLLSGGNLPVVDEAVLDEVLLALLLLLGLEVGGVGGVALLGVAMLALDDIIVLGLLNHHDLVDTPLTSSGNGSNVQGNIITAITLTSVTGGTFLGMGMGMVVVMIVGMASSTGIATGTRVEGEGSPQVLALPVGTSSIGTAGCQNQQT